MGAGQWLSDLLGTKKTSFTVGKGKIDASAAAASATFLAFSDTIGTPQLLFPVGSGLGPGLAAIGATGYGFSYSSGHFTVWHNSLPTYVWSNTQLNGPSGNAANPVFTNISQADCGPFFGSGFYGLSVSGFENTRLLVGSIRLSAGSADAASYEIAVRKSRNTVAAPSVITTGDSLRRDGAYGYVGGTNTYVEAALIEFKSTGAISDSPTGIGGIISFLVRAVGGALTEAGRIETDGKLTWLQKIKALVFQDTQQTITFSATPAVDVSLGSLCDLTLTGNVTGLTFTGGVDGQKITLRLRQDGTGSRTFTFGSGVRFGTDIASITLTTTASKMDYVGLVYNSTDAKYDVVAFTKGF